MHFISHPRNSDQSPNLLTVLAQLAQKMVARSMICAHSALHGLHVQCGLIRVSIQRYFVRVTNHGLQVYWTLYDF